LSRPFETLRVLDLTHVLAGPFATYQLAVLGADVIKIEPPGNPDCARGRGPDPAQNAALRGLNFQVQGAQKRAIALNLKSEKGRALFMRMVETADVVVENYRAGKMAALGLDHAALAAVNPRLIYCSISGFGSDGPRAETGAYDNVIQAAAGIIERTGAKPALSFVDYAAGQTAAFAIAAALLQRERTGRGQYIDCSMYETALMLMAPEFAAEMHPVKTKRDKEAGLTAYRTLEGTLMLGVFTPAQNRKLWQALAHDGFVTEDFGDTPDWESLWAKSRRMEAALGRILKTRSAKHWQAWMHARGLPAERQRTLAEAVRDPQLSARGFFRELPAGAGDGAGAVKAALCAFRFAHDGPDISLPAPGVGEHTTEILAELGLTETEIAELQQEGVT
jgi:crotonobetainyl-CoA:carnitine CoA-transferase CaiB-like acyl-CoA transferase